MKYYFNEEYFAIAQDFICISPAKDIITKICNNNNKYATAYGNININGDHDDSIHQWTFKVLNTLETNAKIYFGIDIVAFSDGDKFGFEHTHLKVNDIIIIKFNSKKGLLNCFINGELTGSRNIGFKDGILNIAVALSCKKDSVKLLKYQREKYEDHYMDFYGFAIPRRKV